MKLKLTKAALEAAHGDAKKSGGTIVLWDEAGIEGVSGFGARITPSIVAFFINYRANGVERRMTVGWLGACSVDTARKLAAKVKLQAIAGADPLAERRAARRALDA